MTEDEDLRRLMRLAQAGDQGSYRVLLSSSRDWLVRYFARRIAPAMIDDLVQETLISLHAKRATYDAGRPFYPWLAAIARYRWIDALRRMRDSAELEERGVSAGSGEDEVLAGLSLSALMTRLPPSQANAIVLTRVEGRSIAEAARICGQSEALVKVNVHRGLKRLAMLVESSDA